MQRVVGFFYTFFLLGPCAVALILLGAVARWKSGSEIERDVCQGGSCDDPAYRWLFDLNPEDRDDVLSYAAVRHPRVGRLKSTTERFEVKQNGQ